MSYVNWRIIYEKYNPDDKDNPYDAPLILEDFNSPLLKVAIGDNKDDFSLSLTNYKGIYNNYFKPNDRLSVYRTVDTTGFTSEDLLMIGGIRKSPVTKNGKRYTVKLQGFNYSELLAKSLVFLDAKELSLPDTIKQALNVISTYKRSGDSSDNITWRNTNPTLRYKKDASGSRLAFPDFGEKVFYRPFSYIMEKCISSSLTQDGSYFWYVNRNNELVWDKRRNNTSSYFDSESDNYVSLKVEKDTSDVVNFVIVKGGYDSNANPIMRYVPDYSSIGSNGFRYYIETADVKSSQTYLDADRAKADVTSLKDDINWVGGFTPTWTSSTYTSYDDYVADFRSFIKETVLKPIGDEIIRQRANGKVSVTVTRKPFDGTWALGDVISCNIPEVSDSGFKLMRVEDIQYSTTTDSYTLVEDNGSL